MEGLKNTDDNTKKEMLKDQTPPHGWEFTLLKDKERDYTNYRAHPGTIRIYNQTDTPCTEEEVEDVIKNSKCWNEDETLKN